MSYANLPVPSTSTGLTQYLQEIKEFPMLEPEEEYMLAKALITHGDVRAADKLVTSHLRLAAKIALGYRGYGLPRFRPDPGSQRRTHAGGQTLRS